METAAMWLAKLDSGSADMTAFEAWRSADPRNAAAFARVAGVTHQLDELKPLMPRAEATARGLRRRHIFTMAGLGAAAAGIAAIGLVAGRSSASTAVGERKSIELREYGVKLDLNTDTRASWRFSHVDHIVWLEHGEIALTVAAGSPPCELLGGRSMVHIATGQINARLRDQTMDLTVLSGECSANSTPGAFQKAKTTPVVIRAGEAALIRPSELRVRQVAEPDLGFISGWQQDEVVLNGQTLDAAVGEYNRYLTHKIVIVDPQLSGIRLGGRFATHDPKDFLEALSSGFDIHVSKGDDGNVLLSR